MDRVPGVIRTPDQRLRVFVSSTLKELAPERRAARGAIEQLALAPVMFELGARPHPPRSLYRAYLEQSDIFVGIYGEQYGWVAPGEQVSGLEDEWNLAPDIPKLVYIKESRHRQERLGALLDRIRDDDEASYVSFADPNDLARLITNDLATLLAERFEAADRQRREPLVEAVPEVGSTEFIRLPSPLTRLLDREGELQATTRMLADDGARLITITGPGGMGKSRFAVAAARAVETSFPDGIAFVDLAPIQDAELVIPAIAHALGLRDSGEVVLIEKVRRAVAGQRLLVVLDNVEQVVEAAPQVNALLADSEMTVLATSRVRLHVSGEHSIELGPLPRAAATELFLERAQGVEHDFESSGRNADTISAITDALDGSPLAIELAAARVQLLTPAEILARLDRTLPMLVDGPRDLPARQQTMRAAIEWSTDLLTDGQRQLLLRLSTFRGGFAFDAAEWMAEGITGIDATEALAALVDGSLVQKRDRADRAWFTMLATVAEYGREHLASSGALLEAEERHARFYVHLAARATGPLMHLHQREWMSRLGDERDGLRAAVAHFIATQQWNEIVDLVWPLLSFWWIRGELGEVERWMNRLLEPDVELSSHSRTIAAFLSNAIAFQRMPDPSFDEVFEEYVMRFRDERDSVGESAALASLASSRLLQLHPDFDGAEHDLERSLHVAEQADVPFVRLTIGLLAGQIQLMRGRASAAVQAFDEILALARQDGDKMTESGALNYLGWTRFMSGDLDGARENFAETLLLSTATGSEWGAAYGLEGLSAVAASTGDLESAGRMFGAAENIRERKGMFAVATSSFYRPILDRILEGPGAERFEAAQSAGRDAELSDIVAEALA